ncbi:hypothetical protein CHLRE_02g111750v5 [Chlamydomonas reinhardtii]|uniref:Uncharacterized protein n=1 Tax=Chlamydomonas reinhardtii TaxID=3055 RepID=A8I365_CHLRE|nr:uncharacterized protein CHLRE_02g111750v5 [Chlamydomonas reinhardtii]PNW87171.1 hypothetical protein CHLRE_02g111750v5 [Chlamydomonas reinhardtii]|eukprot:XP_001699920.1 predicted protein [Chlamydomonas reinhardtii]
MDATRRIFIGVLQRYQCASRAWGSPRFFSGGRLQQLLHEAQTCDSSRREAVAHLLHEWDSAASTTSANNAGAGQGQIQQAHAQAQANELLRLCARQQAVDDAIKVIAAMERRGVTPDADTFTQLHDVFSYFPQPLKTTKTTASSKT